MNKRFEEQLRRDPILREWYAKMPSGPLRKPKPKTEVRAELDGKIAEAAKANPESVQVRVTARGTDNTVVVDAPRRPHELVEVLEVDAEGRPARARRFETETNEWSVVEFAGGYRQMGTVAKDWDPIKRFEEGFKE